MGKHQRNRGSILIEGHNLTLASGTGIATYARQLAGTLRGLGYEAEALLSSTRAVPTKDPVLAQISLFDADRKSDILTEIAAEWRKLSIGPWAAKATSIPEFNTVVEGVTGRLADFCGLHVMPHMVAREVAYFRRYRRRLRVDVDSKPRLFHATRPAPIHVRHCPNIYTLHDIVPLRLPYTTPDDKKLYLGVIRELCRVADHIVTVSEFSRQDIIKLTGIAEHRITNTYQTVSLPSRLTNRDKAAIEREVDGLFGLEYGGYFLFVGALEPKKNVSRLIDAYAASSVKRPLIITGGPGWMNERESEKIQSERFLSYRVDHSRIQPQRSVRRLSYLPFDHLVSLIRGARALLFPSVYEGFGLPVLEAMLLGTPVMTSNVSSLPEVAGDAALLVDPYDIEAMAQAIATLDADEDLCLELARRGRERSKKFSPDAYAARLDVLYRQLL